MSDPSTELNLAEIEAKLSHSNINQLPHTPVSQWLENAIEKIGQYVSWIWLVLMLLIVSNALMRYFFNTTFVALEELQWHLYAVGFMLGLSYCFIHDGHVRVDALAEHWSMKKRIWIETFGISLLLLPFCFVMFNYALPFVERSYRMNEVSPSFDGLPFRWILKSFILIALALLVMAASSRWLRCVAFLRGVSIHQSHTKS
ncbi:TRAP transporter small permease subunit [Marinomonas mediterranea]|jgi:TRAP-type mannitol/chloroaromatic compound transport system, small permease component|uniref:TRAP transporter small permease protein n=1 Tax=Marinomonas mediterranea (strain ATCC 700492 / JCM 21426 / NBRC 103028 / MMB-1) TaxID=717774 RepID=F2JUB6_MARM1|nr:TRAP transporter small permease subunit [Marinomonas mediterranea]ADZ92735.1 Tripartite ATP-independent periplasmic transporter DctQ component [Marinomonas mediterranea MMB-1]WCN14722.1 TRAP transporter small permease subunit [Marinomonas mediterranea]WCN18763.1 TRAP transporter small permease subunit [Marinomonas mediterranea MMB-1]